MTTLTKQQILNNINAKYGLNYQLQQMLASQNTQFLTLLAKQLKFSSYSVPSLALQLAAIFFHRKGYLHFDRFLVLTACFLLASKLKNIECKFKNLCHCFYLVTSQLAQNAEPFNEEKMKRLKDQLSVCEAEILRSLQFELEVVTAQDFIRRECEFLYGEDKELGKKIFNTTRIIVLDSYRTLCSLLYHPLVVFAACFLIASRYEGKYPHQSASVLSLYLSSLSPSVREALGPQQTFEEERLYECWLRQLGEKENSVVEKEEVKQCLQMINSVLF